jgi:hypothetical protein
MLRLWEVARSHNVAVLAGTHRKAATICQQNYDTLKRNTFYGAAIKLSTGQVNGHLLSFTEET